MSLTNCPLSEVCPYYTSGDNKPPNHDVRSKTPCKLFLDMSCEESLRIQRFIGETLACPINKRRGK